MNGYLRDLVSGAGLPDPGRSTHALRVHSGVPISGPSAGAGCRPPRRRTMLAAVLALAGTQCAQATVVNPSWELDFFTNDQSTYRTGGDSVVENTTFLGIDTGFNTIRVGGVEEVYTDGWWVFPSTYWGSYGFELDGYLDLRTGLEITNRNDAGTIDANQTMRASLNYDDQRVAGLFTDFNPSEQSLVQAMQTTFPNVGLDIDFVFDMQAFLDGRVCVADCVDFTVIEPTDLHMTPLPVFDYNRDIDGDGQPDGSVELFGLSIPNTDEPGDVVDGSTSGNPSLTFPLEFPGKIGKVRDLSVGWVTVEVPQAHTQGEELDGDSVLHTAAEDDFLEIGLDLDNIASLAISKGLTSQLFGAAVTIPGVDIGIGYELINLGVNWDMDYSQEFTLDSFLLADLIFSESVMWRDDRTVGECLRLAVLGFGDPTCGDGQLRFIDYWRGPWSEIPDFTITHAGTVEVAPTFDLAATLRNLTELDFDLDFLFELFKIWWDFGLLGNGEAHVVSVEPSLDLFRSTVFDDTFSLEGWNSVAGDPFLVHFTESQVKFNVDDCNTFSGEQRTQCLESFITLSDECAVWDGVDPALHMAVIDGVYENSGTWFNFVLSAAGPEAAANFQNNLYGTCDAAGGGSSGNNPLYTGDPVTPDPDTCNPGLRARTLDSFDRCGIKVPIKTVTYTSTTTSEPPPESTETVITVSTEFTPTQFDYTPVLWDRVHTVPVPGGLALLLAGLGALSLRRRR